MLVKFKSCLFLILFLLPLFSLTKAYSNTYDSPGIFDLRAVDFNKDKVFSLNGHWEFYWNRIINPDSFATGNQPKPDLYGKVPSYWTNYKVNGKALPGQGYCTYRLLILLPPGIRDEIALDIPVFDSSFKIYINGKSAGGNGIVGTSSQISEPGYRPFLVSFTPGSDTIELIVQVSNFQHRRGGFWKKMVVGQSEEIIKEHLRFVFVSYLSMGILLAFSLFFFFFYLFYRKYKRSLFFSIFLAGMFIRLICTGIYPVTLFTGISWEWMVRFEYLGTYIAGIGGLWFIGFLYPLKFMKWVNIVNTIIIGFSSLLVLFSGVPVFSYTMIVVQYIMFLYLFFYMIFSFIKIFTDSLNTIYFGGFILLLLALLNDILLADSKGAATGNYSLHIAVQVFIFMHAVMLIRFWIQNLIEKEKLNSEIEYMNANLEKLISERTLELQKTSGEVTSQHEKIASQNQRLKEEIEFKDRVFSIIAHDIKTPLSSLLMFFDIMKNDAAENVRKAALNSIHNLAISANDLIDNLLYWGRSQWNQVVVTNKESDLQVITDKVLMLLKEPALRKSIKLSFQKTGTGIAYCDPELIQIVIRNLVSNAIKFTRENGFINVSIGPFSGDKSYIMVSVTDDGVGISQDKLDQLLTGKMLESTPGTGSEKGTGIGLRLCFDLVKLVDGKMEVSSQAGKGTSVSVLLHSAMPH